MEFTAVDDDDETQKPAAQPRPIVEPSTMGMWNPPNTDNNANANDAILPMTDPLASPSLEEMAFLVTHWLSGLRDNGDASAVAKNPRWHKIHSLAGELAHAFTEVGVFPRSYIDWKRTYHQLPTRQLEFIVTAATAQANYASSMVGAHSNVNRIQHAIERRQQQLQSSSSSKPNSGRTLQDAIPLLDDNNKDHDDTDSNKDTNGHAQYYQFSALHPPTVLRFQCCSEETTDQLKVEGAPPVVTLISDRESAQTAANAWREFLGARQQVQQQRSLIRNLQQSYDYHQQQIQIHRNNHHQNINLPLLAQNYNDDEIMVDDDTVLHNCQRAMAHLMRQLPLQSSALQQYEKTYFQCQHRATIEYQKYRKLVTYFRPWTAAISSPDNNKKHHYSTTGVRFLTHIQHRCVYGTNNNNNKSHHLRCQQQNHHKPMAILRSTLAGRFAHAATINAHLSYPVYCLKFDKTGRYFITGADDYLVKVFTIDLQLQHNNPKNSQSRRLLHRDESGGGGTSSNGMIRGAVLVCTLKGHAGVVNDIAVSSDNAFLATASEDGDCRIWGLRDGCQIAVLRGHVGGANMVSWSHLTPYRLVTTSADGLARTWDVRKACLQRYGNIVGRRPEYQKKPKHNTPKTNENDVAAAAENNNNPQSVTDDGIEINETTTTPIHVPPLPLRENGDASVIPLELPPLPPLPPAPGGLMMDPVIPPAAQDNNGDFVANDILDEGVLLIAKLPHGTTLEEQRQGEGGPETRSRRIAVKVICVARCPHGGHFATGSDDGICRIWQEEDNPDVEAADQEAVLSTTARHKNSHQTWHTRSATGMWMDT
jgi:WD40 repeat protein